ncbi:unnamed protein product, partial [marine sediment metagenome]
VKAFAKAEKESKNIVSETVKQVNESRQTQKEQQRRPS